MTETEFKQRTKDIALRVIKLVQALPHNLVTEMIGKQLLRSGTSIGSELSRGVPGKINRGHH